MARIAAHRMFDGKKYVWDRMCPTKAEAESYKPVYQKRGYRVRIVKGPSDKKVPNQHTVYIRKRGRTAWARKMGYKNQ